MDRHRSKERVPIVEYQRVGGIAGEECTLRIYQDRKAEFHQRISGRSTLDITTVLDPITIEQLIISFERENFSSFKKEYKAEMPVRDGYSYSITYFHKDHVKTVWTETAGNPPQGLLNLQNKLDKLIEKLITKEDI